MRSTPNPRLGSKSVGLNVLEHDRPCATCGYNLKGLSPGGVCPECGSPIRPRAGTSEIAPDLLEAPRATVLTIGYGCLGLVGLTILEFLITVAMGIGKASTLWLSAVGVCFGLAWVAGVALATIERPGVPKAGAPRAIEFCIRWGARAGALLVPGGFACVLVVEVMNQRGMLPGTWELLAPWIRYGSRASYIPLALAVANLALSGAEESVAWRTRASSGLMVVAFIISGFAAWMASLGAVGIEAGLFVVMASVAWLGAWVLLLIGLAQVGMMLLWAVRYGDESVEREKRRIERERRDRERFKPPEANPIGAYQGMPRTPARGGHGVPGAARRPS